MTTGGQVSVFGKGGKTLTVLLPTDGWRDLVSLRGDASLDEPVFRSRRGNHLDPSAIFRIVRHAAARRTRPPAPTRVRWRAPWP